MNRVALITGAAQGIGMAAVERLAEDGFDVALFDLPGSDLTPAIRAAEERGRRALEIRGDVALETDWIRGVTMVLDHFGRFNKEHGHQAGDAVLRSFAGILLERFRSSDLVARDGGEEFVAILESATLEDATRVAEEVRAALASRPILGPDGAMLRATVSAGCAALDDTEPTLEALLRAADVGLFMAKRAGRNKVVAV